MYKYSAKPPEGVPNPYRPKLHNWRGGPYNEGNLFHGPNYYRPQFGMPFVKRPIAGLGETMQNPSIGNKVNTRNGLFANEGYGGGVFNGNTAFGEVREEPLNLPTPAHLQPQLPSTAWPTHTYVIYGVGFLLCAGVAYYMLKKD